MNIKSFCEVTWDDFQNNIFKAIDKEIDNCKDDYILNVCAEDYITYLERIELDMVQSGRPFSLKYLRERGDFESVSSSFVSFMKNEIKEYKEYIKQQAADPNTQWTEHESVWEMLHEQYDV